jgi:hypothetical protein
LMRHPLETWSKSQNVLSGSVNRDTSNRFPWCPLELDTEGIMSQCGHILGLSAELPQQLPAKHTSRARAAFSNRQGNS